MSETERLALAILAERPHSCTELGERLWHPAQPCHRQCMARPAGKLVKRLMEQGVVKYVFPPKGSKEPTRYTLTEKHERSET